MATVSITGNGKLRGYYQGPHLVSGALYVVNCNNATNDNVAVLKSTDDGDTWSQAGAHSPTNGATEVAVAVDGDDLHIAVVGDSYSSGMDLRQSILYYVFDTSTDSFTTTAESVADYLIDEFPQVSVGIGVRSDGDVVITGPATHSTSMGADYERISVYVNHGLGWDGGTNIDSSVAADKGQWSVAGTMGSNDHFHLSYIMESDADVPLYARTLDDADTLSTRIIVVADLNVVLPQNAAMAPPRLFTTSGSAVRVMMGAIDSAVDDAKVRRLQENATTGNIELESGEGEVVPHGTEAVAADDTVFAYDDASDLMYYFYGEEGNPKDVWYVSGTDGSDANWGTAVEWETGVFSAVMHLVGAEVYVEPVSGDTVIGVLMVESTNDGYEFGKLVLEAAAGVYPPFPRRQLTTVRM
jgi:hypothetical protein